MATTNFYKEILEISSNILAALGGTVNFTPQTPSSGSATTTASQALAASGSDRSYDLVNLGSENIYLAIDVTATTSNSRVVFPNQTYESRSESSKASVSVITASGSSAYMVQEFIKS